MIGYVSSIWHEIFVMPITSTRERGRLPLALMAHDLLKRRENQVQDGQTSTPFDASRRPAQLADVAAAAGVSAGLVSRILRGDETVRARPATRDRVLAAAESLQYTPHQSAQALRSHLSGALGLVVHDIGNPIYAEIVRGAQREASRKGLGIFLSDADVIYQNSNALRALLAPGRIDGLLLQTGGYANDTDIVERLAGRVPMVLVNSASIGGVPAVYLDDYEAARIAVRHLLSLGHERIAYVGGRQESPTSSERRRAVMAEMMNAGLPTRSIESGWDLGAGRDAMGTILAEPGLRPTGLVVANTLVAGGVLVEARSQGVRVPEDLSLVSIHDVWLAEATTPPLTVVRTPLSEMGSTAVDCLLRISAGENIASVCVERPPLELVRRGSTAPPSS